MKILVVGANGQLGHDVVNEIKKRNHECVSCDIAGDVDFTLDATNENETINKVKEVKPQAIINCAAWTAVDAAEDKENEKKVFALNVTIPHNLMLAAKEVDAKLMQISTDYVFDGQGDIPWKPDDKNYKPLSKYGETKLLGELEVAKNDKYFIFFNIKKFLLSKELLCE